MHWVLDTRGVQHKPLDHSSAYMFIVAREPKYPNIGRPFIGCILFICRCMGSTLDSGRLFSIQFFVMECLRQMFSLHIGMSRPRIGGLWNINFSCSLTGCQRNLRTKLKLLSSNAHSLLICHFLLIPSLSPCLIFSPSLSPSFYM